MSDSPQPCITTRDLNLWYGKFQALINVSITIKEGLITSLIGPSGCGKTTLLRCFNRVNERYGNVTTTGEIKLLGKNIYDDDVSLIELRKAVGMVFQRPNPFPKSIYDNVAFGAKINGYKGDLDELVERSLRGAALWDEVKGSLKKSALDLSGGQQQRLCIARAIAVQPDVILMDEPASALDPIATVRIEDLMQELKKDYSIIIVTHNMQQAARVSDETAFLYTEVDEATSSRWGILVEFDQTSKIFTKPADKRTEDYVSGRFG